MTQFIPEEIQADIETELNTEIVKIEPSPGKGVCQARVIIDKNQKKYFLKWADNVPKDLFVKEGNGLLELGKVDVIKVPEVIIAQEAKVKNQGFLLLEFMELREKSEEFERSFALALSSIHRRRSGKYGYREANYLSLIHI